MVALKPNVLKAGVIFLAAVSTALTIIVYLSPTNLIRTISLITVSPNATKATNGPSFLVGIFGSCSKASDTAKLVCVSKAYPPEFDLSVLPSNIPVVLILPPTYFVVLLWIALGFWSLGLVSTLTSIFVAQLKDRPKARRWTNRLKPLGFLIAFEIWLSMFVFYRKAAADFNIGLIIEGKQALALSAQLGSAFFLMGPSFLCCIFIYVITEFFLG